MQTYIKRQRATEKYTLSKKRKTRRHKVIERTTENGKTNEKLQKDVWNKDEWKRQKYELKKRQMQIYKKMY